MKRFIFLLLCASACYGQVPQNIKGMHGYGVPSGGVYSIGTQYIDDSASPPAVYVCSSVTLVGNQNICTWTAIGRGVPSQPVTGGTLYNPVSAGTFIAGTNNFYFNPELTGGGTCDENSLINNLNTLLGFTASSTTWTDSFSSCLSIPSGLNLVTNGEENAISGYIINNNSSQQGGYGRSWADAVNGLALCTASNTACEGIVSNVYDNTGLTGVVLAGMEGGVSPQSASDTVYGVLSTLRTNVQPTKAIAYEINPLHSNYTGQWNYGFDCSIGMVALQNSFYAPCLRLMPVDSGNGRQSQAVFFVDTDSIGTQHVGALAQFAGTNGVPLMRYIVPGGSFGATPAQLPDHGGANNLSPNMNISFGTVSVSASTSGSYTFTNPYGAAPFCTISPTSDPTAVGVYWVTTSTTAVTANVKTSGTITFNFACGPQAN